MWDPSQYGGFLVCLQVQIALFLLSSDEKINGTKFGFLK